MESLLPGSRLGRYQMVEQIGRGGMATVFRARDPDLRRDVAVKVMPSFEAEDPTFIERFRLEAQSVAGLKHPNIIQVHDFGEDKGFIFIVMEFVAGGTLRDRLGERFSVREVISLVGPVAQALGYAHDQGIVHRDVKPANVLLDSDAKPILSDFGLARVLGAMGGLTAAGEAMGTPDYMSPEQALGNPADQRSDLYALGIVMYQMLLAQTPFRGETSTATLIAHIHQPVPIPTTIDPEMDPDLEAVLLRALAKDPDDRYQSSAELVQALISAAGLQETETASDIRLERPTKGLAIGMAPSGFADQPLPPCPYRGLFAFREDDADVFFGREAFVDRLVNAVDEKPLTAILGPSGSGKSSVVFAGLLPSQRRQGSCVVAEFRPGARPIQALALTLVSLLEPESSETDRLVSAGKMAEALSQGQLELYEIMDRIRQTNPDASRFLIITDQFEELFTLSDEPAERARFLDVLLDGIDKLAAKRDAAFRFVLTMRADFLGYALSHRRFADVLQVSDLKLGPMTRGELQDAIEKPAQKARGQDRGRLNRTDSGRDWRRTGRPAAFGVHLNPDVGSAEGWCPDPRRI